MEKYVRISAIVSAIGIILMVAVILSDSFNQITVAQSDDSIFDYQYGQNSNNIIKKTLGDPVYTENTQSTTMRVLSTDPLPIVEVSYTGNSSINGTPTQTFGTITDKTGPDGSVYSTGKAIIILGNGEIITYKSESKGKYHPDGSFSDSGIMMFTVPFKEGNKVPTSNPINPTLSSKVMFDNLVGIYKKTVDTSGKGFTTVWKWD